MKKASSRLLQLIQNYESTPEAQQGMFLLANIYYLTLKVLI